MFSSKYNLFDCHVYTLAILVVRRLLINAARKIALSKYASKNRFVDISAIVFALWYIDCVYNTKRSCRVRGAPRYSYLPFRFDRFYKHNIYIYRNHLNEKWILLKSYISFRTHELIKKSTYVMCGLGVLRVFFFENDRVVWCKLNKTYISKENIYFFNELIFFIFYIFICQMKSKNKTQEKEIHQTILTRLISTSSFAYGMMLSTLITIPKRKVSNFIFSL